MLAFLQDQLQVGHWLVGQRDGGFGRAVTPVSQRTTEERYPRGETVIGSSFVLPSSKGLRRVVLVDPDQQERYAAKPVTSLTGHHPADRPPRDVTRFPQAGL